MRRTTPPTSTSLDASVNDQQQLNSTTSNNTTNNNSAEVNRLRNRISEFEEQFAHIKEEANARVRVLEESLAREQSRNRDREEKETSKRQELISKVHALTEERASLRTQLSQQHDVEDEIARLTSELKESRKECVELKTKALDEKRNFDEQLRDRQRTVEKQAQDISDLQCKLAIVEHKLQLAVARLGQHDTQAESLTDLEEQNIRLSEKLKATERDRRTEKDASDAEKTSLRNRIRELETELHSERDGVSKAEIIADYESKIEGAHRMLRNAFANQSMVDMSTGHTSFYANTTGASSPYQGGLSNAASMSGGAANQQPHALQNSHASFKGVPKGTTASTTEPPSLYQTQRSQTMTSASNKQQRGSLGNTLSHDAIGSSGNFGDNSGNSTRSVSGGGAGTSAAGGFNIGGSSANLSHLAEALHLLDDPNRSESLIRRFIDSAIAARTATASFTASSGLPDASSTDKIALLVQLANVTSERDTLRQRLSLSSNNNFGGDDRSSTNGDNTNNNNGSRAFREASQGSNHQDTSSNGATGMNSSRSANNNNNSYRSGMLPSSRTPPKLNRN